MSPKQPDRSCSSDPVLPFARFRLIFRSHTPVDPEAFLGSAWRGVLGHELLAKACPSAGCAPEQHTLTCRYLYLFETPQAAGKFSSSGTVPHPLVLTVPWRLQSSPYVLSLQLSLFGRAVQDAGLVLDALRDGARKLRPAGPLELVSVEEEAEVGSGVWRPLQQKMSPTCGVIRIPTSPAAIRLAVLTPLRLRTDNRDITPSRFRFAHLFSNLLRRISLISFHHTETPLETDFFGLTRLAEQASLTRKELVWYDMARYSSRQEGLIPMGGLLGEFELSLAGLESLWPYLWLGQFTHAGKGTAMGLGRYQVWKD